MPYLSSLLFHRALLTAAMKVNGLVLLVLVAAVGCQKVSEPSQPVQTTALNDASQDTALEDAKQGALRTKRSQLLPK